MYDFLIVGAGISGLYFANELTKKNIKNFKIIEQKGGEGTVRSLGKGLVNGTFANAWADRPIMDPSIIKSDSNCFNDFKKV